MSYFQNPLVAEYLGIWVLGDRQHSLTFKCPGNAGRSDEMVTCWQKPANGFYDLSGNDAEGNVTSTLNIRMTVNGGFQDWSTISVDLTDNSNAALNPAPNSSSIRPVEIISILNSHPVFSSYFSASLENFQSKKERIVIRQKFSTSRMKFFVINGQAEEVLKFNYKAGVTELPSYFEKSKALGGDMSYPMDGLNSLVLLDPSNSVDANVINNAVDVKENPLNYDSSSLKEDYEFLKGRASGLFTFQKLTVDGSDRIAQVIEYPAGSVVGSLGRKINYTYSGSNTNPSSVTEVPYVLTSGDLVTP